MKTTPIAKPGAGPQTAQTSMNTESRARAVAKLEAAMSPPAPVQGQSAPIPVDANNVSVSDLSAIQPPQRQESTDVDTEVAELTEETPKAVAPVEPPSSQMAILARKERALRAKAQQQDQVYKAKEAALAVREAAIAAKDQEYSSQYISKQRIKQDLLGVMAEEGLSYDELTQQLINQQSENPYVKAQINKLAEQNRKLEEKIASFEKQSQEGQSAQYKAALTQIKSDVVALVKSEPDAYEMIARTNSTQDVVDLIEETFKKDGRVMSVDEATAEVEEYLADEAWKLSEAKKIKARRQQASTAKPSTQSQTQAQQPKQPQTMKTLTNATASTRQLSSKERAILAFKNELKS